MNPGERFVHGDAEAEQIGATVTIQGQTASDGSVNATSITKK